MQKLRYESLLRRLRKEGFRLCEFSMVSKGEYAAADADWNYKDVPHLPVVHRLADSQPIILGEDIACAINLQKILGIWFPIVVNVYEAEKNVAVYYTTLFFFILVVKTEIEEPKPLLTVVKTTYNIAYPRWLFWVMPLLRWSIKRNYHVLMSEDLPMRDRRGQLRKLGYGFRKKNQTYGFLETTRLYDRNVQLPAGAARTHSANYQEILAAGTTGYVGDTGLLGLRLIRDGDTITVWPRTCPHEGASLDHSPCRDGIMTCPWHGRRIDPIGTFIWNQDAEFSDGDYSISVKGNTMTWHYSGGNGNASSTPVKEAAKETIRVA